MVRPGDRRDPALGVRLLDESQRRHRHRSRPVAARGAVAEPRAVVARLQRARARARQDPEVPLLERVRFCSIVSSNLDEFFMVRVAGLSARRRRRRRLARPTAAPRRRRSPRSAGARARPCTTSSRALWRERAAPGAGASGHPGRQRRACTEDELSELTSRFDREIYPVLTPLAVGPGQPFPYISGPVAQPGRVRPRPGERRGALRAGEGARGLPRFVAGRPRAAAVPARGGDRALPAVAVPGHGGGRARRLPRHPRRGLRGLRRGRRPARGGARSSCAGAGSATSSGSRWPAAASARMLRAAGATALDVDDRQVFRIDGMLDLADVAQLADLDRPELRFEPWIGVTPAARWLPDRRPHGPVRGDRGAATSWSTCPTTPSPRRSRRSSVPAAEDPDVVGDQDDRLPHQRRLAAAPGADRRGRGGQADRLPGRAEGPLRRAAATSSGRARWSRRACTSSTASRTSRSTPR